MKASFGHVRDLPEKDIGVEPPDFKAQSRILAKQAVRVAQLKQADAIYLGTDPGREGEAIAWHLYVALGLKKLGKPVYRVCF